MCVASLVLLRNSKRDTKKGDKMHKKWMGPYAIVASLGKGLYRIKSCSTNVVLKKAVHSSRLKQYFTTEHTSPLKLVHLKVNEHNFTHSKELLPCDI